MDSTDLTRRGVLLGILVVLPQNEKQLGLPAEVVVDAADAGTRQRTNHFDRRVPGAVLAEALQRGIQDLAASVGH